MALTQPEPVMSVASEAPRDGSRHRRPLREFAARTYARSLPVVPVRARGMTIEDADGRRYLDCLSGGGSLALGHNHPVVLEAIRSVLHPGAHGRAGGPAAVRDRFAAELSRSLPPGLADSCRIRVCGPGGGEALAAAADLVRKATGRRSLVVFTGSHPGAADGPAPDTGATPTVTHLPYPYDYRCPFGIGGRTGWELCLRRVRDLLDRSGGPAPAGVLVEPVQGEHGGVVPAPDAWLHRLRDLTGEQDVPLVVDESETGVGRTGAFWAVGHSGVVPDVMLLSRAIGGSLPLTVLVHREQLGAPGTGPDSFRGNQLAMAAGAATLAYVRGNRLDERAALLGERMLRRLRELALHHPCIGDVRGRGLMIGAELVDLAASPGPGGPGQRTGARPAVPAPRLAAALQRECLRRGLIVGLGGPEASVVRLLPPLTMSGEQAESVLDRLGDALASLGRTGAE